jgi:predicted RNA-binding protein with TRAM domain
MPYEGKGFDRDFAPKPVEIGREYDVEIHETSRRGEGITRIEGLVVFVPNTKPGDKLRIKVTNIGSRFAEASVIEVRKEEEAEKAEVEAEESGTK